MNVVVVRMYADSIIYTLMCFEFDFSQLFTLAKEAFFAWRLTFPRVHLQKFQNRTQRFSETAEHKFKRYIFDRRRFFFARSRFRWHFSFVFIYLCSSLVEIFATAKWTVCSLNRNDDPYNTRTHTFSQKEHDKRSRTN